MRYGFTTGSCAAAAAKAAAYMLLTGKEKKTITIDTPKGIPYKVEVEEIIRQESTVSCAVRKDGGDDPDMTTGALIFACVSFSDETPEENRITIDGGQGVGRVTKRGLDQPVGSAAINHVPREMIEKEVTEVCRLTDYRGSLRVEISVPDGERLAEKTFNPRLGITGGISILGTTGIVEPMSSQALLDTIRVELNVKKEEGYRVAAVTPGNYGQAFMKNVYGYDLDRSVKCSNFIGDAIDMAAEAGFTAMLLTGHIGKLVKLSGGIMNTHSKEGDCRMELMAAAGIRAGISAATAGKILDCVTTEEALRILEANGKQEKTMDILLEKICFYLNKRAAGRLRIECILYSNEFGELAKSDGAEELLQIIKETGEKE
ncbi:cobalt-precorrin-5B (C(1))-methyltransferase CbiD [Caproiciproducens faecalis]|uniref:Cobalt-precorrin-5B C(1)-methyltransferase n=1 Tax=Caproiciproducens faecalis TaxID=2820301 RepID=A0ABS7DJ85_9FIRM|nr:cobalt-precorrin-5B (C(1))-methyltransferase CbiD [Caproiciproducens faecalis]MBW7571283.1 cobalamin biosynthesis protein CbiD [Caproiciproducens faecalis]